MKAVFRSLPGPVLVTPKRSLPIAIIGQAPSKTAPGPPFTGQSGKRLAQLFGMRHDSFLAMFIRGRLFDQWTGPSLYRKGDAFPMDEARRRAVLLTPEISRCAAFVLFVGVRVAKAFGFQSPIFQIARWHTMLAATIPHTSGVNRWWNNPENVRVTEQFLRCELFNRLAGSTWAEHQQQFKRVR